MKSRVFAIAVVAVGLLTRSALASAQEVVRGTEHLDSDRPEAWAAKYFTSTTFLGGFGVPRQVAPGALVLSGELVWVPSLTTEQRRVGFQGTKLEDLNKAPVFGRPRITVGLPGNFATTVAFVPPVETFGVKPRLVALALERPIYTSESWAAGWRAYGQLGSVEAAFTCPEEAVTLAPGSLLNPTGCLEPSSDVAKLRYLGLELSFGDVTPGRRVARHAAVAVDYLDNVFEVNALRFDFHGGPTRTEFLDRTVQRSDGVTLSLSGGVALVLTDRLEGAIDVFYTPLWVRRQAGSRRQNDGLLNAKALLRYRLR